MDHTLSPFDLWLEQELEALERNRTAVIAAEKAASVLSPFAHETTEAAIKIPIAFIGVFGNFFALIVLRTSERIAHLGHLRVYLSWLCLFDTLALLWTRVYIYVLWAGHTLFKHDKLCSADWYLTAVFSAVSTSILVTAMLDRLCMLVWDVKFRTKFKPWWATLACVIITGTAALCAVNAFFHLWTARKIPLKDDKLNIKVNVASMTTGNHGMECLHSYQQDPKIVYGIAVFISPTSVLMFASIVTLIIILKRRVKQVRRSVTMMLFLSLFSVILLVPFCVMISFYLIDSLPPGWLVILAYNCLYIMYSCKFFVYLSFGPTFRDDFKKLWRCFGCLCETEVSAFSIYDLQDKDWDF